MKRAIAASLSVLLSLFAVSPASGKAWDFPNASSVPNGTTLFALNEPSHFDSWNSWNSYRKGNFSGYSPESHICPKGIDAANCNPVDFNIEAISILPVCASDISENCISGLKFSSISSATSSPLSANFLQLVEGTYYEGNADLNLVGGSGVSLWSAGEFIHSGGTADYSVIVKLRQKFDSKLGRFKPLSITAAVMPFTKRSGGNPPVHGENRSADGITRVGTQHDTECAWSGAGYCGLVEDFPSDIRIELHLRLPKELTGWFRGRLKSPDAEITNFSATNNRFVISGEPVNVPRISALVTESNTSPETQELLSKMGGKNPTAPLFSGNAIKDGFSNEGERVFRLIDGVREAANDSAAGVSTLWNFGTIDNQSNNRCLSDTSRVLGIVTTNASAYEGYPPLFSNGQLTYKVSGVHFQPDGTTPNLGTYDLVMRSDVARCLYGFSNAPVSATIAVQNETGSVNVATKVVNESNGWLKLAAYGFTFSSPRINIKLMQPKKAYSILCYKGSKTKKVTGISPRCPVGYKKKS